MTKTFIPKEKDLDRKCYVINADNQILGHIATKTATILRGKNKPTYTPHLDTGDTVIIINAEKIRVTGNKRKGKIYQRYSGYHSGQRSLSFEELQKKSPERIIQLAVNRMIPKGRLGNQVRSRLRVYAGENHPHQAQKPIPLEVE